MKTAKLLGTLSNGFEANKGQLLHLVTLKACKRPPCPFNDFGRKVIGNDDFKKLIALCGAKEGRKSVGWDFIDAPATCPRCLAKMEKLK